MYSPRPIRGRDVLLSALGQRIVGLRRWVMDLGRANDKFGHGVTTLDLETGPITLRPGPNEEYILVQEGEPRQSDLDPRHWTFVDLTSEDRAQTEGKVEYIDLFTDGLEDIAVLFHCASGDQLAVALVDADLVVSADLAVLESDPEISPRLRERLTIPDHGVDP